MKLSNKPTAHILVKAYTNSDWDNCEFAIIHLSQDWKMEQMERMELIMPIEGNYHFCSIHYYDTAVDFYRTGEGDNLNIGEMLTENEWVFVELDREETFTVPENSLDCYRLILSANGIGQYRAYGKHTSEEFWTEKFSLTPILIQL